jgi:hypothetical protein
MTKPQHLLPVCVLIPLRSLTLDTVSTPFQFAFSLFFPPSRLVRPRQPPFARRPLPQSSHSPSLVPPPSLHAACLPSFGFPLHPPTPPYPSYAFFTEFASTLCDIFPSSPSMPFLPCLPILHLLSLSPSTLCALFCFRFTCTPPFPNHPTHSSHHQLSPSFPYFPRLPPILPPRVATSHHLPPPFCLPTLLFGPSFCLPFPFWPYSVPPCCLAATSPFLFFSLLPMCVLSEPSPRPIAASTPTLPGIPTPYPSLFLQRVSTTMHTAPFRRLLPPLAIIFRRSPSPLLPP